MEARKKNDSGLESLILSTKSLESDDGFVMVKNAPSASLSLRDLFPDTNAVKIYPDDFADDPKNVVLTDLLDRQVGHFSDDRVVILIRPGTYENVNCPVGYWTQVLGLGYAPDAVHFTGRLGVYAIPANTDNPNVGSLDTFWRSAENFTTSCEFVPRPDPEHPQQLQWCVPVGRNLLPVNGQFQELHPVNTCDDEADFDSQHGMVWAVSQAAPLRRICVKKGNLHLSLGANCASGGFCANVQTDYLMLGSQQQFMIRNCDIAHQAIGGAWSMVFNGCKYNGGTGQEEIPWIGNRPLVSFDPVTKIQVEKPYIFLNDNGELYLAIPKPRHNTTGVASSHNDDEIDVLVVDNDRFVRVVSPGTPFDEIQQAVNQGMHIILSPGTYQWGQTLQITKPGTVVLGLGLATIQAPTSSHEHVGKPCIHVATAATPGTRLSGICLEASVLSKLLYKGSTLLQWGEPNVATPSEVQSNPGALHDVYCFVGGRALQRTVKVECMVRLYADYIVGDNLWLWRADHVQLQPTNELPNKPELSEYHVTTYGECQCDIGLQVYGNHVTMYGLAVEHTYKDMLEWHGTHGKVYFYQSELPYDVAGGEHYKDIAGYRVHATAHHHTAKGVGVYSYFRDHDTVVVPSAISHDHAAQNGQYTNLFTVWLNGFDGIHSIVNGEGGPTPTPGMPVSLKSWSSSHMMIDEK